MTNTILAIDLGKFNSVLCRFDAETREASFRTVETMPDRPPRRTPAAAGGERVNHP